LNKREKTSNENVDATVDVDDTRKTNPITGKRRPSSVLHSSSTSTSSSTKSKSAKIEKQPKKSTTSDSLKTSVDDVVDVDGNSGRGANGFYSDPIPSIDEPLPIDLTQLDPADLLPAEMQHYGYSVGPAPLFQVVLPPGMPDDDPAAYAQACRLAHEHRLAAWRRLQAKRRR
jgi:hypothetical protein